MIPSDSRSDQELISAANQGDERAFEQIYLRHRDWVLRLARRITGNSEDALDVLQETFAYFFGKFPGFILTAKLTTFLYPAVRNYSIARLRKTRRSSDTVPEQTSPGSTDAFDSLTDLATVLDALNEGERDVINLRFITDHTLQEIADILEIPLGTVKSRLHNGLRSLRDSPKVRKFFFS